MPAKPVLPDAREQTWDKLAADGTWREKYPKLLAMLTDPVWDDGSPRSPCKLFINVERGSWVITLKEVNQGVVLDASVQTPDEMVPALEALLCLARVPWKHDPWAKAKGKGKK
jgi:hypothetical protein